MCQVSAASKVAIANPPISEFPSRFFIKEHAYLQNGMLQDFKGAMIPAASWHLGSPCAPLVQMGHEEDPCEN
jgi:hypothetical protein